MSVCRCDLLPLSLAVSALTFGLAVAAHAQPAPSGDGETLPAVTVNARGRSEAAQQVPIPLTSIDGEALETQQSWRLEDLQQWLPSTSITFGDPRQSAICCTRARTTARSRPSSPAASTSSRWMAPLALTSTHPARASHAARNCCSTPTHRVTDPRSAHHESMPALSPHPKQLRLSGILDSLEARNRQAIDAKLAYTEFLALLIEDEVARREQKKFTCRLRRAAFRSNKTLDQFDFDRLPQLNRALVHELATGRYLDERAPVLILAPGGTGKSHLAQALGHCAVRQGVDVTFATCTQLTAALNAARATGGYERKLANLARVSLLIIDDFGLKPFRPPADEDLHELMAERYESAATIVTSNLDLTEWDQAFPANKLLASATLDRMRHNAYCLVLDGKSYRSPLQFPTVIRQRLVSETKSAQA